MSLIGPVATIVILLPLAFYLPKRVALWIPERRRDVTIIVLGIAILTWGVIQSVALGSDAGAPWEKVALPLAMGVVGGLAGLVTLSIHLWHVDGAPGRFIRWMDTGPLYSWVPEEYRNRKGPLWTIVTPRDQLAAHDRQVKQASDGGLPPKS